jgi:hypothetical protein
MYDGFLKAVTLKHVAISNNKIPKGYLKPKIVVDTNFIIEKILTKITILVKNNYYGGINLENTILLDIESIGMSDNYNNFTKDKNFHSLLEDILNITDKHV